MIQRVLAQPDRLAQMTQEDWRALTPLIYHHINPYGIFSLGMTQRLALSTVPISTLLYPWPKLYSFWAWKGISSVMRSSTPSKMIYAMCNINKGRPSQRNQEEVVRIVG